MNPWFKNHAHPDRGHGDSPLRHRVHEEPSYHCSCIRGSLGPLIRALCLTALTAGPLSAAELRCPPRLPGPHPGFEQVGPIPAAHWLLRRMNLFEGPPGEEMKTAPAQLAPDSTTKQHGGYISTWRFAGVRDLLVVCTYDGSDTYYRASPSPLPRTCVVRDDNDLIQAWCQ